MTMRPSISSTKNPIVRRFRDTAQGESPGEIVVDGLRVLREALDAPDCEVLTAAIGPRLEQSEEGRGLRARLLAEVPDCLSVDEKVLAAASILDTPQGGLAIVRRAPATIDGIVARAAAAEQAPLIVLAAGVRDPGNLGAIVRAAEAAGAHGCVTLAGGADPFRVKAVRGSSGSVLRLPVTARTPLDEAVARLRSHGLQIVVAAAGEGAADYVDVDYAPPTAIVVGAEARGAGPELLAAADRRVCIPMLEPVESLNVAVASGLLLFEARRQRR